MLMRADAAWQHMRHLPVEEFGAQFADGPIMILAPHPDDESLGCGGLIAEACGRNIAPVVVILTDGSKSHPRSRAYPPERLRDLREAETRAATCRLGLPQERLVFLRFPDTRAPSGGEALRNAAFSLLTLIDRFGCRTLITSWSCDPHCDHAAAAAIAEETCRQARIRLLAYPVWGWCLPPEAEIGDAALTGFRLDVRCHLPNKRAAIDAHRSQYAGLIDDDPDGFQMPPGFIEHFLAPTEVYLDVAVNA
jgi:LmbE family N-acetylglucosaminyl deacetylase